MDDALVLVLRFVSIFSLVLSGALLYERHLRRQRRPERRGSVRDWAHWVAWNDRAAGINESLAVPLGLKLHISDYEGQYSLWVMGPHHFHTFMDGDPSQPGTHDPYDPPTGDQNLARAVAYILSLEDYP